ncbi:MAG: PHP domain-containing protein [Candidatus Auribacterota bacterium]|jgi:predicted metal-dependent phosphoesterase TrpH|nr:PHP domain-containing protein [Candidatus Auribacterota bacterium]
MEKYIDLHIHSTKSDGLLDPLEIVRLASQKNLAAISITDHDSIEGYYCALNEAKKLGVTIVPGVEMSCEEEGKDIHLLGYFIDGTNRRFLEYLETMRQHRRIRIYKIADKLKLLGVDLCADTLLKELKTTSPGRPHIAKKLLEKGFVSSAYEAFSRYIGENCPAYVKKFKFSVKDCISLIHEIGGLAVLAHPAIYLKDHLIERFVKDGLDGLEVIHSEHSISDMKKYKAIAKQYGLLETGGSDFHGASHDRRELGGIPIPYSMLENMQQALWQQ